MKTGRYSWFAGVSHVQVLVLAGLIAAGLGAPPLAPHEASAQVLFESDGSSLDPFSCVSGGPGTFALNGTEGNPAPSIGFSGGGRAITAPYTLPQLAAGQVLHGSVDVKIDGSHSYLQVHFGDFLGGSCTVDYNYPHVPWVLYSSQGPGVPHPNAIFVYTTDALGQPATDEYLYTLPTGAWFTMDLTLTPVEGGSYTYVLTVGGEVVGTGSSYEPIGINEQHGATIGTGSNYNTATILYDNLRVELETQSGNVPGSHIRCFDRCPRQA